jgi:hypothetical protein
MLTSRTLLFLALAVPGACMPPSWGAGALLHPGKTMASEKDGRPHQALWFEGDGVRRRGWWFKATLN